VARALPNARGGGGGGRGSSRSRCAAGRDRRLPLLQRPPLPRSRVRCAWPPPPPPRYSDCFITTPLSTGRWTTFESAVSTEALARLAYYEGLGKLLEERLPPKVIEIDGEGPRVTEAEDRADEGMGPRNKRVIAAIEEAAFTGKGDQGEQRDDCLGRGAEGGVRGRVQRGGRVRGARRLPVRRGQRIRGRVEGGLVRGARRHAVRQRQRLRRRVEGG